MKKISIVIPALNEETGLGPVLREIPISTIKQMGYETEILVVDNGSTDRTPHIAREHGATVIFQPLRGYGNAYKAGFAHASGEIIATGDADFTYPFAMLPFLLRAHPQITSIFCENGL
jgi:glycosyltransferase involved in cell wall biosynthesis